MTLINKTLNSKYLYNILLVICAAVFFFTSYYFKVHQQTVLNKEREYADKLYKRLQKVEGRINYYSELTNRLVSFSADSETKGDYVRQLESVTFELAYSNKITAIKAVATNPVIREDLGFMRNSDIKYSQIELTLEAEEDTKIYKFLNQLLQEAPGYLQVTQLKLNNSLDATHCYVKIIWHLISFE